MFIHEMIEKRRMPMNNARVIQYELFDIECWRKRTHRESYDARDSSDSDWSFKFLEIYEKWHAYK